MIKRISSHLKKLAYLGECYVQLELAKYGFRTDILSKGFYCDLIGENLCRIEVKTALPGLSKKTVRGKSYSYKSWQFRLSHPKQSANDIYVYVLLEGVKQLPIAYFILPRSAVTTREKSGVTSFYESDLNGTFYRKTKIDKNEFLNNWNIILNWKTDSFYYKQYKQNKIRFNKPETL